MSVYNYIIQTISLYRAIYYRIKWSTAFVILHTTSNSLTRSNKESHNLYILQMMQDLV